MDTGNSLFLPLTKLKAARTLNFMLGSVLFEHGPNFMVNGFLELGRNHVSLVSQVDSKMFAYCIGNISDAWASLSTLSIGNQFLYDTITLVIIDYKYYVNLVSIEFDSTSTTNFFPRVALDKLEKAMGNLLDPIFQRHASVDWKCNIYTYDRLLS
ncbi:hypothetical protein ACJIZ3_021571 [Penstemon smallii]|uniref:Uncharacterized protein n=1 Tax=Penstemon smallii TaxID=265156 RepID=A0ABD3SLT4_9LAMI